MNRKCLVPGCNRIIGAKHAMCVDHWKQVPRDKQQGYQERARGWNDMGAAREFLMGEAKRIAARENAG